MSGSCQTGPREMVYDTGMELDPVRCYQALLSRDRRFDGRFFGGVTTTRIYCRPVCPVRPARAENVRWFVCAAAAEEAGFRPCRRCRPETSPGTPAWLGSSAVVSRALRLILEGALDAGSLDALASRVGLGPRQLARLFATHLGASPVAIARARRVHFARRLLDETALPIGQVALSAGFASVRQFNHAVRATFGRSPRELRTRRRGEVARDRKRLTLRLPYRPPLDWAAIVRFLGPRATPGVEVVETQAYRRTITAPEGAGMIELRPGDESHLVLSAELPGPAGLLGIVERARRLFDLGADPLQVSRHLAGSPALARIVRSSPGLRIPGAWDGFELAVRAVLGQQVTVRGATTLTGRLVETFGERLPLPFAPGLTHLFPVPRVLAAADVSVIGIPAARAATISRLAAAVSTGELVLDAAQGLDDAVARLCAIPGIGEWTAHYIAMRALGEPDAFPATDLGLRRALGNGAGPATPTRLAQAAEAWRPWRAYAAMYLWASEQPMEDDR